MTNPADLADRGRHMNPALARAGQHQVPGRRRDRQPEHEPAYDTGAGLRKAAPATRPITTNSLGRRHPICLKEALEIYLRPGIRACAEYFPDHRQRPAGI